jgi:hypothetical protein
MQLSLRIFQVASKRNSEFVSKPALFMLIRRFAEAQNNTDGMTYPARQGTLRIQGQQFNFTQRPQRRNVETTLRCAFA